MTIAAGFLCHDGIVIASDTLISTANFKDEAPKIYPVIKTDGLVCIIAGAGPVMHMDMAVDDLQESFEGIKKPSVRTVRSAIIGTLKKFYEEHVFPVTWPDKPAFELLIAVWLSPGQLVLFSSSWNAVSRVRGSTGRKMIGSGEDIAVFSANSVNRNASYVEESKLTAAFCIAMAKRYAAGCGGQTKMWVLNTDGSATRCITSEIKALQDHSLSLFGAIYDLSRWLGPNSTEQEVDMLIETVRSRVKELRSVRQKIALLAEERRRAISPVVL